MPQITIILPVLNAMPFLTEALASLEIQTFRDFEVCLWDNGSTDGSLEEAHRWIPERLSGRVVSGNPLPLHQCLERMVVDSKTEFLARMDGDDICLPDRLNVQFAEMNKDDSLAALGGQLRFIDETGKTLMGDFLYPYQFRDVLSRMLFQCPLPHPAVMFRRSKVVSAGNYRVPKPMEDFDLWFRLANEGSLRNLKDPLLLYRITDKSVTNQAKSEGTHNNSVLTCIKNNVPHLFNIPHKRFAALADRRHPLAFTCMPQLARAISLKSGIGFKTIISSPEFLDSIRCLTSRSDFISRVVYRFWEINGKRLQ